MKKESITARRHDGLFYSKILLFGEYSVISGSMALSVPFSGYGARFSYVGTNGEGDPDFENHLNGLLGDYCSWLEFAGKDSELAGLFDIEGFKDELERGLYLDSDIPEGYGLGSSGALCASVYDRFAINPVTRNMMAGGDEIYRLKRIFALMESKFHGTSSGLDPLTSWLNRPVRVNTGGGIDPVDFRDPVKGEGLAVFLIDTGRKKHTGPLVDNYLLKMEDDNFRLPVEELLIPSVNSCISTIIDSQVTKFFSALRPVSKFQMEYLGELIPGEFNEVWRRGIEGGDYFLKLCGSGGGGYLLGFARDIEKSVHIISESGFGIISLKGLF